MAGEAGPERIKPRVVFDCMVFLQGAGRPEGPARACFRLVDEDRVALFLSHDILTEVRDVLTRPKTLRRFPLLSTEWVETFVQNAASKAVVLAEVPVAFSLARDPKDERYVNLAIAARAQYLISRDRDLLDLMDEENFRQRFPGLTILDPAAFLEAVGRQAQPERSTRPGLGQNQGAKGQASTAAEGEKPRAEGE
jgi:putative PIN family toxin of toxin-antitoxin system